ncbi:MAG: putative integral membrane protein [Ilumatobacter sp.]|jgi:uncharacterized integral membrane protein
MSFDENNDEFDQQPGPAGQNGPSLWLLLVILVAIATAVFILQNGEKVAAEMLWFDREIKLWVAIVVSIGLGILLDRLILTWWRRARRHKDDGNN